MTTYAQIFCTLAELDADLDLHGSEREEKVYPKIEAASQFLLQEVGRFIPVTLARTMQGSGKLEQYLPDGLLSITSFVNNGVALTTADYMTMPNQADWPNGPYTWLRVDPDATNLSVWNSDAEGLVITGKWGLYSLSKSTGSTVASNQSDSATSLVVSNGSKLSPGMILLIGSEQQLVSATGAASDSTANLGAAISDAHETLITLTDVSQVNAGEIIRVGLEQMKVLDTLSATQQAYVIRGWNNTMKAAHSNSTDVYVYRTFTVERGVNGTTAAAHDSAVAISRYHVPADVNQLARKIAGRMLKDSQSGYSGIIGDEMTGQARYQYVLPFELEAIQKNYRIHQAG